MPTTYDKPKRPYQCGASSQLLAALGMDTLTAAELAERTGNDVTHTNYLLWNLRKTGKVVRTGRHWSHWSICATECNWDAARINQFLERVAA